MWLPQTGGWALTGSSDGTLRLWDEDGALVVTYNSESPIMALAPSPDGSEVVSSGADGRLERWLIDRSQIATALSERLCVMYQGDDAQIRALLPQWEWRGCSAIPT